MQYWIPSRDGSTLYLKRGAPVSTYLPPALPELREGSTTTHYVLDYLPESEDPSAEKEIAEARRLLAALWNDAAGGGSGGGDGGGDGSETGEDEREAHVSEFAASREDDNHTAVVVEPADENVGRNSDWALHDPVNLLSPQISNSKQKLFWESVRGRKWKSPDLGVSKEIQGDPTDAGTRSLQGQQAQLRCVSRCAGCRNRKQSVRIRGRASAGAYISKTDMVWRSGGRGRWGDY